MFYIRWKAVPYQTLHILQIDSVSFITLCVNTWDALLDAGILCDTAAVHCAAVKGRPYRSFATRASQLKFWHPEKSLILSCDTVVANERYAHTRNFKTRTSSSCRLVPSFFSLAARLVCSHLTMYMQTFQSPIVSDKADYVTKIYHLQLLLY